MTTETKPNPCREARQKVGLTQQAFAQTFRIPLGTIQNWEQDRVPLNAVALTLLRVIEREPEAALRAMRNWSSRMVPPGPSC